MSPPSRPLRVLLVEDSQDDAELILFELAEAGFDVACKRVDNEAAMRGAMMNERWDIVISDFRLPEFSAQRAMKVLHEMDAGMAATRTDQLELFDGAELPGWKARKKTTLSPARKSERRSCPFIIVSGCVGEESAIALMREGASDFVMKNNLSRLAPVVERELKDAVARRERREAQDALRAHEKLLREITDALGEGLLVLDEGGMLKFMNPEAERLLGWCESELLGKKMHQIIHSQKQDGTLHEETDCGVLGVLPGGGVRKTEENVFWRKDGTPIPVSIVASAIMENGKAAASVVAFQDISLRKLAEHDLLESRKQLRELSAYLQTVREEERARIARELHDELGQMLTGVKLDAKWLATRLSGEQADVINKIASMSNLIDATLDAMRRVAADLRPVMLDDLGLAAAVEWLVEDFGERTGVCIRLEVDDALCQDAGSLDAEVSTAAFRIVQECLTNAARHAQADQVLVSLECDKRKLLLMVADNGKGMASMGANKSNSFGIIGMRERVQGIGGKFYLFSIPGEGTTVLAIIPIESDDHAGAP